MKFDKAFIMFAIMMAMSVSFVSCDDDDDYTSYPSLGGNLVFSAPDFVRPLDVVKMKPSGAYHPKGEDFGYYWTATDVIAQSDTTRHIGDPKTVDGTLELTIPDTLMTITVTCSMFADGYSNMSAVNYITIVTDESLTNIPAQEGEAVFVDERDGKEYSYLTKEGLDWMTTNLKYAGEGFPYSNCEPMTDLFGNLYTWEQAQDACPEGWRIPTEEEWKAVCGGSFENVAGRLMVDAYFNGERMWEYWPKVDVDNAKGMNLIPSGYGVIADEQYDFEGLNEYATAWTSSAHEEQMKYISVYVSEPDVFIGAAHKHSFAASVRCVRENVSAE